MINQHFFQTDIENFINKFQQHDAVIITALHTNFYKHKQQILDNNKDLYSALFAKQYPITELRNSYIDNFEQKLHLNDDCFHGSYLVVNRLNAEDFVDNLAKLAQFYQQEHIFVIRGGDKPTAFLLGTKNSGKIHLGQIIPYPECHALIGNPEFFRQFLHQKFYFTGAIKDNKISRSEMVGVGFQPSSWLGRWACASMGKKVLRKVGILHEY